MSLMDTIKQRRSIRKYQDKPLPPEALDQILEAVRWAPSWANTQCWEVVVVTDQDLKQQLADTLAPKNPATKAVSAAQAVLVLCGRLKAAGYYNDQVTTKFGDWFMFDLGLAAQNLCLAAHDLGLSTVIVGLFDQDKAAKILGVPDGFELVTMIPLGYPKADPSPPKRREISEFTHYDKF